MNMIKCALQFWRKSNQHCPNHYFTIIVRQIKSSQIKCWFLMRGENRSTRGKTSQNRVENQQTQSTYDAECGNRTRATLVEVLSPLSQPCYPPHEEEEDDVGEDVENDNGDEEEEEENLYQLYMRGKYYCTGML